MFITSAAGNQALPGLSFGQPVASSDSLDYATFATELVAYLTKEVLSDSADEYVASPLGSRWSSSMPDRRSEFGGHCLEIVGQLGSAVPRLMPGLGASSAPSITTYALRAATAGLALRQIWSAFEHDVRGDRTGVSLDPKVSARRVGVNLTLHW